MSSSGLTSSKKEVSMSEDLACGVRERGRNVRRREIGFEGLGKKKVLEGMVELRVKEERVKAIAVVVAAMDEQNEKPIDIYM